jgi:SAM-dependent methyltransferase
MADTHEPTSSTQTVADKNREHWDKVANTVFKESWVLDLHKQITDHVTSNLPWLNLPDATGRQSKMLDYACGNGFLTAALYKNFDRVIGVDLSDSMLAGYRERMQALEVPESQAMAVRGDMFAADAVTTEPALNEEDSNGFDLAAIVMALHHVEDASLAVKRLGERMRPGGVLLVVDICEGLESMGKHGHGHGDSHGHAHGHAHEHDHAQSRDDKDPLASAAHTITYGGFKEQDMRHLLEPATWDDVSYVKADAPTKMPHNETGEVRIFFARATKRA